MGIGILFFPFWFFLCGWCYWCFGDIAFVFVGVVCVCATVLGPYIRSQIWTGWFGFGFLEKEEDGGVCCG